MFIIILIALFVCGWYFLWKKKYFILIESAGENADGIKQVLKTQLEISLTEAEELAGSLPKTVRGGNFLNAKMVVKAINEAGGSAKLLTSGEDALAKDEQPEVDENGKKKKGPDSDAKHSMGEYAFTPEDVDAVKGSKDKAYAKLVEAMNVGGDNFYPETLAETQQMDALLDESEKAAKGIKDVEYHKMLKEMRGIVGWSSRRHFNFSWGIILGSLITIGVVLWIGHSNQEDKKYAKEQVEKVEAWNVKDTLSLDKAMQMANYENHLQSPALYRAYEINTKENLIASCKKNIEEDKARQDTASTKEIKANIQKWIDMNEKEIARHNEELKEIRCWDNKDTKKAALERTKKSYKYARKSAFMSIIWSIIFLALIPLYIFANYSWGYVITRTRTESAFLQKFYAWTAKLSAGMFALGGAIHLIDSRPVDSSGARVGFSNDGAINTILMAAKFFLLVGAVVLIAFVSLAIMIYSIIVGLKRNYGSKA